MAKVELMLDDTSHLYYEFSIIPRPGDHILVIYDIDKDTDKRFKVLEVTWIVDLDGNNDQADNLTIVCRSID